MLLLIPLFLCWGSFLNVVAYRLIRGEHLVRPRSHCPQCNVPISWYDNIPVLSWLWLRGKCRNCQRSISQLYPVVEILTAGMLYFLYLFVPLQFFFAYFIFFSALIVTFRSDLETMLISQWVTLFLIPLGPLFSMVGWLPISLLESVLGAILGYLFLFAIGKVFYLLTGKMGIGAGDFELLALIGAFSGIFGAWLTLLVASITGSLFGIVYLMLTKSGRNAKIPFGPFLSLAAIVVVLVQFACPYSRFIP